MTEGQRDIESRKRTFFYQRHPYKHAFSNGRVWIVYVPCHDWRIEEYAPGVPSNNDVW